MLGSRFGRYILVVAAILAVIVGTTHAAKKSKSKKGSDKTVLSGSTPSGATEWRSESSGTISTKISSSHLGLSKTPVFFTSLSTNQKRPAALEDIQLTSALLEEHALANLTGTVVPRRPSIDGFSVRLRYSKDDPRNLTASTARVGNWRIHWVAVTDGSSLFNGETDLNPTSAYVRLLEHLVKENPVLIKPLLGKTYELPESLQPKPKPEKVKKSKEENTSEAEKNSEENAPEDDNEDNAAETDEEDADVEASYDDGETGSADETSQEQEDSSEE